MAIRRLARLESRRELGAGVVALDLRMIDGPLSFIGGQYVIAETGLSRDGKPVKRAFSLASSDQERECITLVVRRHGDGSSAMLARGVADEIGFSGPWGKCFASGDAPTSRRVIATSIGVTAAIGLARSARFARSSVAVDVVVNPGEAPVIDADALTSALATPAVDVRVHRLESGAGLERFADDALDPALGALYLVGDGAMNVRLMELALRRGVDRTRILVEHFFAKPAPDATAAV